MDVKYTTFPDDWMPFMVIKKTTTHASSRHSTTHHLRPPLSSIEVEASSVVRYQK